MSTYREVKCYVINQTGSSINYQSKDISHGEFNHGGKSPISTISSGTSKQEVFYIHKTTGSLNGCTGNVKYTLPDGSELSFMFNCPYTFGGSGATGNGWFYAVIRDIPSSVGATNYYVSTSFTYCDKDGNDCKGQTVDPPTNNELIEATVTIYNA